MKKTNINITSNTTIHGTHTNGNAKAVIVWEKVKIFYSMTDAAEDIGCSIDSISNVIRDKQSTANGFHVTLLSKINEDFPKMMKYLPDFTVVAKAKAYDKLMDEQEKARKAEERKAKALHEAEMEVLKYERKCKAADGKLTKYQAILDKNSVKLIEAQEKLRMLKGGDKEC